MKKEQRQVVIQRPKATVPSITQEEQNEAQPKAASKAQSKQTLTPSPTGSIALASAEVEQDPFKKNLINSGYSIIYEDEYGVIARQDKGKPVFMARTKNGYSKPANRNSVLLPDELDTAMKVRAASLRLNTSDYISRLIIDDLKSNNTTW